MGRNRKRKYPTEKGTQTEKENIIPIQNLPENYLAIKLRKKQVKMKNLLTYAFDKCQNHEGVLWSATGDGIEKLISLVEIFKRTKTEFQSQINRLRYTKIEVQKSENEEMELKNVPEMFIYLSREPKEETRTVSDNSKTLTNETMRSLAGLNLKLGQKRPSNDNPSNRKRDKKKRRSDQNR